MWLLRRRRRFRVTGDSMNPTLNDHDFLLANMGYYRQNQPEVGDVVVLKHPFNDLVIIKRIVSIVPDGIMVMGDNTIESSDSRSFGALTFDRLLGRVTSRI